MSLELDPDHSGAFSVDQLVLAGLYHSELPVTHDSKWTEMGVDNAAFAREALVKAQRIREEGSDAGNAYLEGIADFHAAVVRQAILNAAEGFSPEEELKRLDNRL